MCRTLYFQAPSFSDAGSTPRASDSSAPHGPYETWPIYFTGDSRCHKGNDPPVLSTALNRNSKMKSGIVFACLFCVVACGSTLAFSSSSRSTKVSSLQMLSSARTNDSCAISCCSTVVGCRSTTASCCEEAACCATGACCESGGCCETTDCCEAGGVCETAGCCTDTCVGQTRELAVAIE